MHSDSEITPKYWKGMRECIVERSLPLSDPFYLRHTGREGENEAKRERERER